MGIVVSDTSPIRALECLSLLDLLPKLFQQVWVPPAVAQELLNVSIAIASIPFFVVQSPADRMVVEKLREDLDPGESEAIALALELGAQAVLIDEAAGRTVAEAMGLTPRGVLGILVDAKKLGHIDEIAPLIAQLRSELGFRMSDALIRDILTAAGE
jgi:predicted nucleic acid-binding protein